MKVHILDDFRREFARLPKRIQEKARKSLEQLEENPFHPSLHTKRMRGVKDVWESRVTLSYRVTFSWKGGDIWLRRVGTHDILDREGR